MQVELLLDQPHTVWTNLDVISGKAILKLPSTASITSIVVKLEGETRTRLLTPAVRDLNERPSAREETHKSLYKVAQVFPSKSVEKSMTYQNHLTLSPGRYEFPFELKIPFNNSCYADNQPPSLNAALNLAKARLREFEMPLRHVKTLLPPTLTALPGLAEIRYYLKVTVNRKEFYKENPRVLHFFNFLPIEPPRPRPSGAETYARRQHDFAVSTSSKKKGVFEGLRRSSGTGTAGADVPPHFSVDARLPSPAIITCNEDIPLRLVVKRLNNSSDPLYLHSLHVQLVGYTHIRAHDVFRDETNAWVIVSRDNLGQVIALPRMSKDGQIDQEVVVEEQAWRGRPLPSSVAPSFATCNIGRKYALEIRVGIGYGNVSAKNRVVLPLQHSVQVYSGIKPPAALLAAISSSAPARKPEKSAAASAPSHLKHPLAPPGHSAQLFDPGASSLQAGPSTVQYEPLPLGEEEPPPSYEDVIGQDLPPVDGPRRAYEPPSVAEGGGGFDTGDKRRRGS